LRFTTIKFSSTSRSSLTGFNFILIYWHLQFLP